MKTPEQIPLDFSGHDEAASTSQGRRSAQVIRLEDLAACRESARIARAYEAIRQSIAHIDITRARRLAIAREERQR